MLLVWRHQDRQCQLDELFVFVDGVQAPTYVVSDFGTAALFDPVGQFKNGGLKGQLVFVDFVESGGKQI